MDYLQNLSIDDFKRLLSLGLSFAIVLGSLILKIPQIVKIIRAKSCEGLSAPMFMIETVGFCITTVYAIRRHFPFRAYGENVFILAQNATIDMLLLVYGGASLVQVATTFGAASLFAYLALANMLSDAQMASAQAATILLFISSKVPQILKAQAEKSTGELDLFMVLMQSAGTAARVFTSLQDANGDFVFVGGFVIACLLNVTMLLQVLVYGNKAKKSAATKKSKKE